VRREHQLAEDAVKLVIIRHAIAVARGTPDVPDDERPLTEGGKRRFKEAARGLVQICGRPDVLLTSPLPRAAATAEIAAKAWGRISPTTEPALVRGSPDEILVALSRYATDKTIAIVGHEPMLSVLLARLLGSAVGDRFTLRKGGVAYVDVPGPPALGGRLDWLVRPKILRALGAL
jgi:phosphohistidine phosphatase